MCSPVVCVRGFLWQSMPAAEGAHPCTPSHPGLPNATSGETAPRSPASPLGLPSREASAGAGSPVAPALSHSHSGRALPKAGSSEIAPGSPAGAGGAPRDAGQQGAGSPVAPALSHTNSGRLPKSKPGGVFLSGRCWLPPGDGDTVRAARPRKAAQTLHSPHCDSIGKLYWIGY